MTVSKSWILYPEELANSNTGEQESVRTPGSAIGALRFWLVPLTTERSTFTVSIQQVLPTELWDRDNHQLIFPFVRWLRCVAPNIVKRNFQDPDLGALVTAGVARIQLHAADETCESQNAVPETAIMVFGLSRFKLLQDDGDPLGNDRDSISWCRFLKDDGVASLEENLTSQVASRDAQPEASLVLDSRAVLRGSAVQTMVSGSSYALIKLWVTNEVREVNRLVAHEQI